jgi:PhnB protein
MEKRVMRSHVPEGWHSITPRLVVEDPSKLVQFLKVAFQATGDYSEDRPALMKIGDSIIMVSGAGPRDPKPSFLYVYVEDTDATYQRAVAAGATSIEAPTDMPYGDRRAMVTDPFGNDWQIATHKGVVR